MDWTLALQHNQTILLRNVAWLFTWLKLDVGGSVETLPRLHRLTVLFVLRPSESACRRLVMVAMYVRGIVAPNLKVRGKNSHKTSSDTKRARTGPPAFRLTDPRKKFDLNPNQPKQSKSPEPRVTDLWSDNPIYDRSELYAYQERMKRLREATGGEEESAKSLSRRMNALIAALNDLDGQALRMARLIARIERRKDSKGKPVLQPLRPGLPPGFRQRTKHEVDAVLLECHRLARMAQNELKPPDH